MLFSPGMVANYLVMTNLLQLKDTIWALILPLALGPFNILVMRTFSRKPCLTVLLNRHVLMAQVKCAFCQHCVTTSLQGLPQLVCLRLWVIGTIGSMRYLHSKDTLVPLQYLLMKIQNNLEFLSRSTDMGAAAQEGLGVLPSESARMAIVVLSTLPIALTYPFFQKYFVGGLTIGGVKE